MNKITYKTLLVFGYLLCKCPAAFATTITFTDAAHMQGVLGTSHTFSQDGVQVTAYGFSSMGLSTAAVIDNTAPGLGIMGGTNSEIDNFNRPEGILFSVDTAGWEITSVGFGGVNINGIETVTVYTAPGAPAAGGFIAFNPNETYNQNGPFLLANPGSLIGFGAVSSATLFRTNSIVVTQVVPVPGALLLFGSGLVVLKGRKRVRATS